MKGEKVRCVKYCDGKGERRISYPTIRDKDGCHYGTQIDKKGIN